MRGSVGGTARRRERPWHSHSWLCTAPAASLCHHAVRQKKLIVLENWPIVDAGKYRGHCEGAGETVAWALLPVSESWPGWPKQTKYRGHPARRKRGSLPRFIGVPPVESHGQDGHGTSGVPRASCPCRRTWPGPVPMFLIGMAMPRRRLRLGRGKSRRAGVRALHCNSINSCFLNKIFAPFEVLREQGRRDRLMAEPRRGEN